jgi:SAM-dependent methyltransferase
MINPSQHYEGHENLSVMSKMGRYNEWIYHTIAPYLGPAVLEAGCGNGNLTHFILATPNLKRYIGVDLSEDFCRRLQEDVSIPPGCTAIFRALDLQDPALEQLARPPLTTIVCSNVLEHLADDASTLQRFHRMLERRGKLILQAPALQWLYGSIDEVNQHYRRYSRRDLAEKIQEADFSIVRMFYFNLLGIPAWIWHGRIRKLKTHPVDDMRAWDKWVPLLRAAESLIPPPLGLSLFAVGEKR